MQARNGVVDVVVADEAEATVAAAKRLLGYFQGPTAARRRSPTRRALREIVPERERRAYAVGADRSRRSPTPAR